ncbi:MAG TPA: amidase [Bryobacteraceae bacterium]|nr:amidase [Bryobacteraceae bacterium]
MQSIRKAAAALRARQVSCVELVTEALRAEESHRDLNCFITLLPEVALQHAKERDAELAAGHDRGPLHGIPIAHKDLYHTAGIRTTNGSRLFADFVPEHDAVTVNKLNEAGTVSLGKLNMHELAYGITSTNPHYGPVRNPHDRMRIPGGSSGGSGAVVGAGIVFAATGSDTGGSIRVPASFCGVVGLKPTFGSVSTEGCFPLGASLDTMGPLAASVEDVALMMEGMTGAAYPINPDAKVRVGIPENYFLEHVHPDVVQAIENAARTAQDQGAELVAVRTPDPEGLFAVARTILMCEAATALHVHVQPRHELGADVLALLDAGSKVAATEYIRALSAAARLRQLWAALFDNIDVLFTPTTPTTAPLIGQGTMRIEGREGDTRLLTTRFVRGINLLGYPAISMPWGTSEGLPIGLQIVAPMNADLKILNLAAAMERAR